MTIRISDFSRGTSQSNVKPKLSPTRDRYPLTDGISLKMSEILGSLRRHRDTKKTPPPPGFCSVPSCLCGSICFKSWIRLCRVGLSCIHSIGPRSTNERTETNWCRAGACRHAASFSRKAARRRATALHSIASLRLRAAQPQPNDRPRHSTADFADKADEDKRSKLSALIRVIRGKNASRN